MREFPHLNDTRFPNLDSIDVYKYRNEFDYARYDYSQMRITMCAVPWDMGEAHIGNRTISGIGNVVYFGSEAERDAWFAAIPDSDCIRFSTKYKDLHTQNYIDLPIPFDVACRYNYIAVEYSLFANDDSPVDYEHDGGLRKWFWFIRECEFLAPNATRLNLLIDAWQTFIYSVEINGMMLERGHAPMAAMGATEYLTSPISKADYLLAPDVDFGEGSAKVKGTDSHIFNSSDTIAVFVTSADVTGGTWGSKSGTVWQAPGISYNDESGYPTFFLFGIAVSDLATFIANMQSQVPQFAQTVKGIFFISQSLFNLSAQPFTFCGVSCYALDPIGKVDSALWSASKSEFAYPTQYADIAKLYTWPYAHLEVTDETGNVTVIRVEETTGTLLLESSLNALFPQIAVNAHIIGYGSAEISTLSFKSVDSLSFDSCGKWYDTLYSWDIPMFGIIQDAGIENDYATHYDRQHQKVAADGTYSQRANDAANRVANAGLQQTANTSATTADNTAAIANTQADIDLNTASTGISNEVTSNTCNDQVDYQYASGAISAGSAAAGAVVSAVTNPIGAVASLIGGVINAGAALANTQAGVNYTTSQAGLQMMANSSGMSSSNSASHSKLSAAQANNNAKLSATNALVSGQAANDSATTLSNAVLQRGTEYNAIDCQIAQSALSAPVEFGQISDTALAASRPMGIFVNTVTESDYAIARAGDEFLRYGYNFNRYWEFDGNWNVCEKFTYWKVSDFWVKGLNVPDAYMDRLRFFLFGGVTVWSDPAYIGYTSIYENGL